MDYSMDYLYQAKLYVLSGVLYHLNADDLTAFDFAIKFGVRKGKHFS